ncbi:SPOR domain-containing protein, partial [Gemmatimonas sp.]
QFTVSFAAILDEKQARALATRIRVDGQSPRITTSERAGKTLYRVVLGPFPSRAEAERVGKASGQSYWIFEGAP